MVDRIGEQLGNYRLIRLLGRGGFAEVFLGKHVFLGTQAAIKVLQLQLAADEMETFLNEARTIAHLEHPHIVRVLDFGMDGSVPFLAMSYAPHGNVRQRYPKGTTLLPTCIMSYVKQVAHALQYAHDQKLIHRDVKPENILLGQHDNILLSDFGLAVVAQSSGQQNPLKAVGTLAYMAPEQLHGKPCFASDQYALGITVYEWLCGMRPFSGSPSEIAIQHLHILPPSPCEINPSILPAVEQVVLKALAKNPQQRFASILDFTTALDEACQPRHPQLNTLSPGLPSSIERTLKMAVVSSTTSLPIWNVPYRRNPFFTGREDVLTHLHEVLTAGKAVALTQAQAISGLGGIGKTQTAIEYAYRYQHNYQAVLWVKADTRETLISDFVTVARLLDLSQKDEQYQSRIVVAVKRWLEANTSWLLILDNIEDLTLVSDFVPFTSKADCHTLLTTRAPITGAFARCIDLEKMEAEEGALFLLRRSKLISPDAFLQDASDTDHIKAREISLVLGGLPLALDQAGAYIEETACGLSDYLCRYQTRCDTLLNMRGGLVADHSESVTATFSLSFEKVERINPVAAELLRLCAFLHPDAIPEEIILDGAPDLGSMLQLAAADPFKLDAAISELRKFSLVRRNPETKMLTIHRLVQAVLRSGMEDNMQRQWAERTVRAVNRAFPEVEFATWQRCQRCLPHGQTCASLIEQWGMTFTEAARLLDQTGAYLLEYAQYVQAEQFHQLALTIREQALGPEHPDVANSLINLAKINHHQGKYAQAEPLMLRALAIREHILGLEHPDVASCMNLLSELNYAQGKYAQTEALLKRSLAIRKQAIESELPLIAQNLNDLGVLYHYQGKYEQAELLLTRSLTIREETSEPELQVIAETLNNLGVLYHYQGKFAQAEVLYQQALAIDEMTNRTEHPDTAFELDNLARLYRDLGKYTQAELLFQQALAIREQALGLNHPFVAESLNDWARLCYHQGKYASGDTMCQRALTIWEQTMGKEHPRIAQTYNNLAMIYHAQGKYACSESLYQRTLSIREQTLGSDHPKVAQTLNNLARLYCAQNRIMQAEQLLSRARTIYEQTLGPEHPRTAQTFSDLAMLYLMQGKYTQAEMLFQRALNICEKLLGPEHPDVAQNINRLAKLHYARGEYAYAESLVQRALDMREKVLGPEHPDVAESLNDLARFCFAQRKYAQAEPHYHRALAIREQKLGREHPDVVVVLKNYALLLLATKRRGEAAKLAARAKAIREKRS